MKKWLMVFTPILLICMPVTNFANENKVQLSDVVQFTLDHSPTIKNASFGVDVTKGAARAQGGAFNIQSNASFGYATVYSPDSIAKFDQQTFSAGLSKRFRSGVGTSLSYSLSRLDGRFTGAAPTSNTGSIGLVIEIPLLKGAWEVSAAAAEKAAILGQNAAESDFRQLISATLLGSIQAYWNYSAAYRIEDYRHQAQNQVESWMQNDELLSVFLKGFLAEKKSNVVSAVQQVEQARLALARAVGIPTDKVASIGIPDISAFPSEWDDVLNQFNYPGINTKWLELAVLNRNDIKAANFRVQASETNLAKAEQDLYPSLNINGGISYEGVNSNNGFGNFIEGTHKNGRGLNNNASLNFSYPIGNDVAEGTRSIAHAQKLSSEVTLHETIRGIKISVGQSIAAVHGLLKTVIHDREAMESYIGSINHLVDTSDLSIAENVTNLIVLHDKLDTAAVAYITALAELGNAIVQARFQTGVLINNDNSIAIEKIVTLPGV